MAPEDFVDKDKPVTNLELYAIELRRKGMEPVRYDLGKLMLANGTPISQQLSSVVISIPKGFQDSFPLSGFGDDIVKEMETAFITSLYTSFIVALLILLGGYALCVYTGLDQRIYGGVKWLFYSEANNPANYRREIDGLRAIAVLSVILFHTGFSWIKGGFVGVDVFFVISGYLITSIILSECEADTFTLAGFYERRIRRILPALFLVMLCSLPAAYIWLLPDQMASFARSFLSGLFFVSNYYFISNNVGYFARAAEEEPLLHLWSLAVEEQYYIFFPLLAVWLWRGKEWNFKAAMPTCLRNIAMSYRGGGHLLSSYCWWRSQALFMPNICVGTKDCSTIHGDGYGNYSLVP
jgi:hypothetical protein